MKAPTLRMDLMELREGDAIVEKAQYVENVGGSLFTVTIARGKKLETPETVKIALRREEDPMRNHPRLPGT